MDRHEHFVFLVALIVAFAIGDATDAPIMDRCISADGDGGLDARRGFVSCDSDTTGLLQQGMLKSDKAARVGASLDGSFDSKVNKRKNKAVSAKVQSHLPLESVDVGVGKDEEAEEATVERNAPEGSEPEDSSEEADAEESTEESTSKPKGQNWVSSTSSKPHQSISKVDKVYCGDRYRMSPLFHVPDNVAVDAPIIILLHWINVDGEEIQGLVPKSVADDLGMVLAFPTSLPNPDNCDFEWRSGGRRPNGYTYTDEQVQAELDYLTIELMQEARDAVLNTSTHRAWVPRHVFATGFSGGGEMSYRLAVTGLVDAIAPISGALVKGWRLKELKRPVSVCAFHGTKDTMNHYDGDDKDIVPYMSVEGAMDYFCHVNGLHPVHEALTAKEGIIQRTWCELDNGFPRVELYTEVGIAHVYPELDTVGIDSMKVIIDFFARYAAFYNPPSMPLW